VACVDVDALRPPSAEKVNEARSELGLPELSEEQKRRMFCDPGLLRPANENDLPRLEEID